MDFGIAKNAMVKCAGKLLHRTIWADISLINGLMRPRPDGPKVIPQSKSQEQNSLILYFKVFTHLKNGNGRDSEL